MDREQKIQAALSRICATNVLQWAREHATVSLVDLNKMVDAGVAPIDLEHFMAEVARQTGEYDLFVRTEAVRRLNEYFPEGFRQSQRQQYGLASGWAMWASLFEPLHKRLARETWRSLEDTLRDNPDWRPLSPDDELVLRAFQGRSFAPTDGAKKLAAAVRRMNREAGRNNRPFTHAQATRNLSTMPRGYRWLYGLYAVDGEVCNGGFEQYYGNTGGWPTAVAIDAFHEIGADGTAQIVEESLASALLYYPEMIAEEIEVRKNLNMLAPRPFNELDAAYYASQESDEPEWLEVAMTELVLTHPSEFA